MKDPSKDLTIIVRECGERTADACVRLLAEIHPDSAIHRVSARPFHETLRQSLELGLAEGRAWTLCIDADVLVLPEITDFLNEAVILPSHVFGAQALIQDKLIPSRRPAGNHLYRTERILQALPLIPTSDSLRPETDMIQAMVTKGFPYHQSRSLVGLHDFEQTHRDIYMKAFLHGYKHRYLMHWFKPVWEELCRTDDDYQVALAALDDALRHEGMPRISRNFREQEAHEAVAKLKIQEKLPLRAIDTETVRNILESSVFTLSHEARSMIRDIQAFTDNALSPALARQENFSAPTFPLTGKLRRWFRRIGRAMAVRK